jgi:iron(III) transport system permease protein
MMFSRLLPRTAALAGRLLLLAPLAALVPAALLDLGPEGGVRFSIFPLVLTLHDPTVATSLGQSLALAAAVAGSSALIGGVLAGAVTRRAFWGRPLLRWVLAAAGVLPPAFLALGILGLPGLLAIGIGSPADGSSMAFPTGWRWAAWAWASLVPGTAWVLEAVARALEEQAPEGRSAARLAGAGPFRTWRDFTWPAIRPALLAAALGVFVLTLADPGPPLILGLRRTLGFQVVATLSGREPFPRAAVLGLLILAVALLVRLLWGLRAAPHPSFGWASVPRRPAAPPGSCAGLPEATATGAVLLGAAALAYLPLAGLVRLALQPGAAADPALAAVLPGTAGLAAAVGLVLVVAARIGPRGRPEGRGRRPLIEASGSGVLPPLVVGVGLLALLRVAALAASWLGGEPTGTAAGPARLLAWLAGSESGGAGAVLLWLGVCLAWVPAVLGGAGFREAGPEADRRRVEQALLAGAGRSRALELARAGGRAIPPGVLALWSLLAAVAVAPAVVLGGPEPGRSLGPAVVALADGPPASRAAAGLLALGGAAACLSAWAAARARPGSRPGVSTHEHLIA